MNALPGCRRVKPPCVALLLLLASALFAYPQPAAAELMIVGTRYVRSMLPPRGAWRAARGAILPAPLGPVKRRHIH